MTTVIFDLFETLITEWGRPKFTTRETADTLDIDYQTFRREWESLHGDRYAGKLSGTAQILSTILKNLGTERSDSLINEISQRRDECKLRCFEVIEPDILDMLSALKEKGLKIGLISNCSREEISGLEDCELYKYLDAVVLSCDVGIVKPNIKIYEHCLAILGENPENCLFIGDGGSDELNGAKTQE